jgi:hypothetical protein
MRLAGHVTLIADVRNAYKYLVGKSGSIKSIGIAQRQKVSCKNNNEEGRVR